MTDHALPYRAVLFDFDYTLADSSEGIILCVNHALQTMRLSPAEPDHIRATIGLSLVALYDQLSRRACPERAPEFVQLFMRCADEVMADHTRVYPSVPGMLEALRDFRLRLGILSTKYRYRIEAVLQRDGLLTAFELIIGGEDVHVHKPDPEGLLLALRKLEYSSPRLLYVGDSAADAEAAERAGVPFVGVLSGVTPVETLRQYAAEAILPDVSRLPRWLGSRSASRRPLPA